MCVLSDTRALDLMVRLTLLASLAGWSGCSAEDRSGQKSQSILSDLITPPRAEPKIEKRRTRYQVPLLYDVAYQRCAQATKEDRKQRWINNVEDEDEGGLFPDEPSAGLDRSSLSASKQDPAMKEEIAAGYDDCTADREVYTQAWRACREHLGSDRTLRFACRDAVFRGFKGPPVTEAGRINMWPSRTEPAQIVAYFSKHKAEIATCWRPDEPTGKYLSAIAMVAASGGIVPIQNLCAMIVRHGPFQGDSWGNEEIPESWLREAIAKLSAPPQKATR